MEPSEGTRRMDLWEVGSGHLGAGEALSGAHGVAGAGVSLGEWMPRTVRLPPGSLLPTHRVLAAPSWGLCGQLHLGLAPRPGPHHGVRGRACETSDRRFQGRLQWPSGHMCRACVHPRRAWRGESVSPLAQ